VILPYQSTRRRVRTTQITAQLNDFLNYTGDVWRCHLAIVTVWDWYLANIHVNRNSELKNTVLPFGQAPNCEIWRLHSFVDGDSQVFLGLTHCRLLSSFEQSKAVSSSPRILLGLLADIPDGDTVFVQTFFHYLPLDAAPLSNRRYSSWHKMLQRPTDRRDVAHIVLCLTFCGRVCSQSCPEHKYLVCVLGQLQLICHLRLSKTPSLQHLCMNMK